MNNQWNEVAKLLLCKGRTKEKAKFSIIFHQFTILNKLYKLFKQATFLIIFIIKFNFTLKYNLFKNLPNHVSLV